MNQHNARQAPALVRIFGHQGEHVGLFGSFNYTTSIRFQPICLTTFTSFKLEARNVVDGNGDAALKHVFEFDPDDLDDLEVELISERDARVQSAQQEDDRSRTPPTGMYGYISFSMPSSLRPVRTYGRAEPLPDGSVGQRFSAALPKGRAIQVICHLPTARQVEPFRAFHELMTSIRCLTADGQGRSDWHLLRDEHAPGDWKAAYVGWLQDPTLDHSPPEWLTRGNGSSVQLYKDITAADIPMLKSTFPSMKSYINHFIPALLYKRRHNLSLLRQQFNTEVAYKARVQCIAEHRYLVSVKLTTDDIRVPAARITTTAGQEVSLWIAPALEFSKTGTSFDGAVVTEGITAADFAVDVRMGGVLIEQDWQVPDEEWHTVYRTIKSSDAPMTQNLFRMQKLANLPRKPNAVAKVQHNLSRRIFDVHNIIGEQRLDIWSANFIQDFQDAATKEDVAEVQRLWAVLTGDPLNAEQKAFFWNAIQGARSNTKFLEGLPGTGKSKTLGYLIIALLLLGHKVVATAHSNFGVDELFRKVVDIIESKECLHHLLPKCMRLHNTKREDDFERKLHSGLRHFGGHDVHFASMAKRVEEYAADDQGESEIVGQYLNHVVLRKRVGEAAGIPKGYKHKYSAVRAAVRNKTLGTMAFVAGTTFVVSRFDSENLSFKGSVLIIDEAAQAPEPDAMSAIVAQLELYLLVIAGDT